MSVALITGAAGLIGSESVKFFCERGYTVVGIDNDMRSYFFGEDASTRETHDLLVRDYSNYIHHDIDIRDQDRVERIFREYGSEISLIIHTASQPSHDWAVTEPLTDFTINANGTLVLLENTRQFCQQAAFIFTSTNKVYGYRPNELPLIELETRWEVDPSHPFHSGIDESMDIDQNEALLVWCLKGCSRCNGSGIRALFWNEYRLFPRRVSNRTQPRRDTVAWLPFVLDEMRNDRHSVHGPGL